MKIVSIPLQKIVRNPFQPRRDFDDTDLRELAQSIGSYGVIQPILVRQQGDGYQLIAGERRFRACHLLGLYEIPAIIQEMDDEKAAAVSLIENLQRRQLSYFEEASAYSILINVFGMTQEEVAKKVGRSQSAIANKLRLLRIPESVRSLIETEQITERHARALLKIGSSELQIKLLEQIYEKDLTVKETEQLVEGINQGKIPSEVKNKPQSHNVSMIIRDARIFINTIKETVKRARQIGIDIEMNENDQEEAYEMVIKIAKQQNNVRRIARN